MKIIRWLITIAHAGFIFYLSSRVWGGASPFPFADKVIHVTIYFILGGLCFWALQTTRLKKGLMIISAIAAAAVYGLSDEIHQHFVPGREMNLFDWIADIFGGTAGAGTVSYIAKSVGGLSPNGD